MDKIIQSEQIHAYTHLGEPVPFVPRKGIKKDGPCPSCNDWISVKAKNKTTCPKCKVKIDVSGFELDEFKKTSTADMKEFGLFLSVSRATTHGEMPFELVAWSENRLRDFSIKFYRENQDLYYSNPGEWNRRYSIGLRELKEEFGVRGTFLHGLIQRSMEGEQFEMTDPTALVCIPKIKEWEASLGATGSRHEIAQCNVELGLAGCLDLCYDSPRILADFKTKHSPSGFKAMKSGSLSSVWNLTKQLAGYEAITMPVDEAWGVFIRAEADHPETGETIFKKIVRSELDAGRKAILDNVQAWYSDHRYDPRVMYKQGRCQSRAEIMGDAECTV